MATKPSTKRKTSNLPVNYEEQMAAEAAEIAKRIAAPTGDRIRMSNKGFRTPDGMEGDELEVVIVDFTSTNLFYDSPYDRDNPQSAACFAIGAEPTLMVPSPNSPVKQAETCAACPNNQFGSADNGKGKACKNMRMLALMPSTALDDPDEDAPIWTMSVPPTSLKAFDGYVSSLANKHRKIPIGVVTRIYQDPNETYVAPRFEVVRPLQGDELGTFMTRREEANARLNTEPDVSGYQPPKAKPGRRR